MFHSIFSACCISLWSFMTEHIHWLNLNTKMLMQIFLKKITLPVPVRGNRDILTSLQTGLTFRAKALRYVGLCNLKCQICLHRLGSESNFCRVWCCSPILNIFITSFVSWCLRYSQNLRLFFFKFLRTKVPIISAFAAKNRDLVGKPPTAGRYFRLCD